MTATLKMIFTLDNEKTSTISLANPRENVTAEEIQAFAEALVAAKGLVINGSFVTALKSAKVQKVDSKEFAIA